MKTKLLGLLLLVGSSAFAGPRFFFGVGVAPPTCRGPRTSRLRLCRLLMPRPLLAPDTLGFPVTTTVRCGTPVTGLVRLIRMRSGLVRVTTVAITVGVIGAVS